MDPLPPPDEACVQALVLALAPTGHRAQTPRNRAAPVTGWTPTLRRANYLRCRWQWLAGEYCGQQPTGGAA